MICIKHAALLVYFICGIVNIIATDLKQIQRRIERERQVEKIKNEIMKNLGNSGIWINKNNHFQTENTDLETGNINANKQGSVVNVAHGEPDIDKPESEPEKPRNPIISIGEQLGDQRGGCLQFAMNRIPKTNNNVSSIIPKRINLWVHIRKRKGRSKRNSAKIKGSGTQEKNLNRQKRNSKSSRKKEKGRKIKLFISNGNKRLSKMRMRIRGSGWHSIDLPISQFPEIIHSTDKYKICIQCKRCNKKVKVDLYRKQKSHKSNRKPMIPFIHIETADNLAPHNIYRHKRSHLNRHHCKQSCCKLENFSIDISKTFPTILAPKEILFTYCLNTCETDVSLHNTSVIHKNLKAEESKQDSLQIPRVDHHRQCLPQTYNSFSFLYLLPNTDVMFGTIPNMFPSSCRCSRPPVN